MMHGHTNIGFNDTSSYSPLCISYFPLSTICSNVSGLVIMVTASTSFDRKLTASPEMVIRVLTPRLLRML